MDSCLRWFEAELNPSFNPPFGVPTPGSKPINAPRSTDWADTIRFGDVPFSVQRVTLLLRAIVKKPDLVVLDEAFSGMDEYVRNKCMLFLTWGETRSFGLGRRAGRLERFVFETDPRILDKEVFEGLSKDQALICVSHIEDEVPGLVREWMALPEASSGKPAKFGRFNGPLEANEGFWDEIWGV